MSSSSVACFNQIPQSVSSECGQMCSRFVPIRPTNIITIIMCFSHDMWNTYEYLVNTNRIHWSSAYEEAHVKSTYERLVKKHIWKRMKKHMWKTHMKSLWRSMCEKHIWKAHMKSTYMKNTYIWRSTHVKSTHKKRTKKHIWKAYEERHVKRHQQQSPGSAATSSLRASILKSKS